MSMLKKFWNDEAGLEAVEYAVIASLIVIAIVLATTALGDKIANSFNFLATKIKDA